MAAHDGRVGYLHLMRISSPALGAAPGALPLGACASWPSFCALAATVSDAN